MSTFQLQTGRIGAFKMMIMMVYKGGTEEGERRERWEEVEREGREDGRNKGRKKGKRNRTETKMTRGRRKEGLKDVKSKI